MLFHHTVNSRLAAAAAAGLALMLSAAPVHAADSDVTAVRVRHVNLSPESQADANRLLARLSEGAMEACGASSFSVRPHRQAVRGSTCWRTSMTDAVARIDNARLTAAFVGRGMPQVTTSAGDSGGGR